MYVCHVYLVSVHIHILYIYVHVSNVLLPFQVMYWCVHIHVECIYFKKLLLSPSLQTNVAKSVDIHL
jgi:hypothetical protein